jgi:putative FmdB family regulatory protein
MPLYEYQCAKCGAIFEVRQKFSDAPLTQHEGCGGEVTKQMSAPAFHLKGGGWYATDYVRTGAKSDAKAESAEKSETSSDSAKTDAAKPAETKPAETKPAATPTTSTTKSE